MRKIVSRKAASESGYLYLILFDNSVIKAGYTHDPADRNSRHARDSGRYGLQIVDRWNSEHMDDVRRREGHLLAVLRQIGTRTPAGREYFRDIPFSIACYQAQNLPRTLRQRCCCGNRVDALDARLSAVVVGIPEPGPDEAPWRTTPFELRLPCGAVVAAELNDVDLKPGGNYPLEIGDQLIVELLPGTVQAVYSGYVSQMPVRSDTAPV